MKYDRLIIEILMEAGSDGLTVRKVSRHVFNAVNGLFDEADIEAVHKLVRAFLQRHSKGASPALDRPKHGSYALNRRTAAGRALIERLLSEETDQLKPQGSVQELSIPFDDAFSPLNKAAEGANCLLAAVQNLNKQIFSCHFSKNGRQQGGVSFFLRIFALY